jgi:hypothetical protein
VRAAEMVRGARQMTAARREVQIIRLSRAEFESEIVSTGTLVREEWRCQ